MGNIVEKPSPNLEWLSVVINLSEGKPLILKIWTNVAEDDMKAVVENYTARCDVKAISEQGLCDYINSKRAYGFVASVGYKSLSENEVLHALSMDIGLKAAIVQEQFAQAITTEWRKEIIFSGSVNETCRWCNNNFNVHPVLVRDNGFILWDWCYADNPDEDIWTPQFF